MAKSNNKSNKTTVKTINPPNSGMMDWLKQQTNIANTDVSTGEGPSEKENKPILQETPTSERSPEPAEPVIEQVKPAESAPTVILQPDRVGEEPEEKEKPAPPQAAPVVKKAKNKGDTQAGPGKYQAVFFKKPVKSDEDTLVSEAKPVRISEESHWLLSVLVQEARRQGHKINVGDLIDNLLENHRMVHKTEVDELIQQWKSRKRIG